MRTNWTPTKRPLDYSPREVWNRNRDTGQRVKMVIWPEHPPIPDIILSCPDSDRDEPCICSCRVHDGCMRVPCSALKAHIEERRA